MGHIFPKAKGNEKEKAFDMNKYFKKKKMAWYILVSLNVVLFIVLGMQYGRQCRLQQSIAGKVLRFHVLANSDSESDQQLKLKVRDAVGAQMAEVLSDAESLSDCERLVTENMEEIRQTAEKVIAQQGYDYTVEAFLQEVSFPVKTYGDYTFPAGEYEALELVIGAGEGHNWWCVMYPNMCFSGTVYEVVDEDAKRELRRVLSEDEYEEILISGDYEVQFKYFTFLNGLVE